MNSFLKELAQQIYTEYPSMESLTLVFPNRRASLYFRKHLSELIARPVFAPQLLTIEEFITSFSQYKVPDKLELVYRLHQTYQQVMHLPDGKTETFDQFYFWGDMLLRDFDEIDKYLVNAAQLFKDLRNLKEMDSGFDYLTDEQRKFLEEFWLSFEENLTENKKKFIEVWSKLYFLYDAFKKQLRTEGLAYEGMLHREVAESFTSEIKLNYDPQKVVFVGFNALTKAEERILGYFVERGSRICWDGDDYYVNNDQQEAGLFFREYQKHAVLKKTFPSAFPANFKDNKHIQVFGSAQSAGQVKMLGQLLTEQLAKGMSVEDTLLVLPDEKLLVPVLYSIPDSVSALNVTMGYSLSSTPFHNLIESLAELQIGKRNGHYNHRAVMAILGHPYVIAVNEIVANAKRKEILKSNWVSIPQSYLATELPLHRLMFGDLKEGFLPYLSAIIHEIGAVDSIADADKEYAFHFIKLINRVQEILGAQPEVDGKDINERTRILKSFLRLIKQLVNAQKIPFSGEPLKGLQIMGVLETRNLDFKNVFILSMNEGALPSFGGKGSYVPFNVKRAYGLPTVEHQDAIYAYLFYRVLQRAENIFFFYNTETDRLGQGEMSRYLQQLIYESGLPIVRKTLHNPVQPAVIHPIVIRKDQVVLEAIHKLNNNRYTFTGISPSAINTYLDCRLKFYFQQVAGIKEPKEVEDTIDARILGNFLHTVMERFYRRLQIGKNSTRVEVKDFENAQKEVDNLIDEIFKEQFRLDPNKPMQYEGQQVVVREIVKRFAHRILYIDKLHAPFTMEAIETENLFASVEIKHKPGKAVYGGKIDRVDSKENVLRIIDYKTGSDSLSFKDVDELFNRSKKNRNKAAFQTFLYALLYRKTHFKYDSMKMVPGLFNRDYLFKDTAQFGFKQESVFINDISPMLPEFEMRLTELFEEIFDPEEVFDQTDQIEICRNCPYQNICYR
jgi:CRISPR/Cas system-associated exonuclease Cas4 (RecB family)